MKKAVFFDIDGTLIDCINGVFDMSPKVKEAIRKLQKAGHYVFIATGRPYSSLSQNLLDFGFNGFILTNGAQVIINDETVYADYIDKHYITSFVDFLEKHNVQYILEGAKYSYLKSEFKDFYDLYDKIGISHKLLKGSYDLNDIDVLKLEMLCTSPEATEGCFELVNKYTEFDNYNTIDNSYFEMYPKKNTKATGILKALDILNIKVENSFAFGDGKNDIEMLQTVGCGIAMDNALDEVKIHADKVTESVYNDGVAVGIEKYILD
ncbi:MAG: HAD family hydrolase [Clostridiaceae bacterium]|nr:HAD family hydrolase [Clostridiaceae bacterium]